jgi:hypothetical protein
MINKELLEFVREARKRGFDDSQIKEPLLKKGWAQEEIEKALAALKQNPELKNRVTIYLDKEVLKIIDKRAKKNMLTIEEQIEDIIRRSCIMAKQQKKEEQKIDDLLVSIFSRKKYTKKSIC